MHFCGVPKNPFGGDSNVGKSLKTVKSHQVSPFSGFFSPGGLALEMGALNRMFVPKTHIFPKEMAELNKMVF